MGGLSSLDLINSTVSGNNAATGAGIGVHPNGNGPLMLANTTIAYNEAHTGGAAAVNFPAGSAPDIDVRNTIIADQRGNTVNCDNHAVSAGNNLSSDSTCNFTEPGDITNGNAALLPLFDNDGPTLTHGLLPSSDAIEAGDPASCAGPNVTNIDQRGVIRPQGPQCDIGAVEYNGLVFQIATHYLNDGTLEAPYSQILSAVGGTTLLTWVVSSGQLPDGFSLDFSTGEISGVPQLVGEFEFTVSVNDQFNSAERDFSITIVGGEIFQDRFEE